MNVSVTDYGKENRKESIWEHTHYIYILL